jgi:hypothetical protein
VTQRSNGPAVLRRQFRKELASAERRSDVGQSGHVKSRTDFLTQIKVLSQGFMYDGIEKQRRGK